MRPTPALLISVVLVGSVMGCGSSDESTTDTSAPAVETTSAPTTTTDSAAADFEVLDAEYRDGLDEFTPLPDSDRIADFQAWIAELIDFEEEFISAVITEQWPASADRTVDRLIDTHDEFIGYLEFCDAQSISITDCLNGVEESQFSDAYEGIDPYLVAIDRAMIDMQEALR